MIVVGLLFLLASTAHVLSQYYEPQCIEKEKEALLSFKRVVVDPHYVLPSWSTNNGTNQNCCNWIGVTCGYPGSHVIKVDLQVANYEDNTEGLGYPIGGEIGSSLIELRHLQYLNLRRNNFIRIPKFIGSFKELTDLNLAGNPISGAIPPELGNLTQLEFLDLSSDSDHNKMTADDFEWLSHLTSLTTFTLTNANFTKAGLQSFKVPPFLLELEVSNCLLPKVDTSSLPFKNSSNILETLTLTENVIHPTAITWFLNSSIKLADISLKNNGIDGSFPDSFGEKNSLSSVSLSGNEVESGVPKSLGNLTNLKDLDLSSNNLGGTLHDLLENLTAGSTKNSLENLWLDSNKLGGLILDDEKTLPSLTNLCLDSNHLEGPFPNRLSRFPNLIYLFLADNQLTGPLPDLSSMSSLYFFGASKNKFNSTSTESIGELRSLQVLDVSSNSLSGVIPEKLFLRCPLLQELDLSYNSDLKFHHKWVSSVKLTSITLISCKLGPQFPSWLQSQSNLQHLDISNSDISGSIPNWFGNITSGLDFLNMSFNLFNSTLPYFPLVAANKVDLSFNQFKGPIPTSLVHVRQLYLNNNKFTECRSFLCDVKGRFGSFMFTLDLSNNQLFGSLPDCWWNFHKLVVLDLGNNKFSGEIPSSINSSSADIQTLQLRNNNFSGKLPSSLRYCTELRVLDFGKNSLEGTIPSWIGERLTSLVVLDLKANKFYGSIPLNLCRLTRIQVLDLSLNELSGVIPSCIKNFTSMVQMTTILEGIVKLNQHYGIYTIEYVNIASVMWKGVEYDYDKNLGFLRIIDLSSNKLTGEIPIEVTALVQLVQLNLSRNDLSGDIPMMIGNLTKLESLDLSDNDLSGKIPRSLAEVSSLAYLDLSNNQLSGRIPTSTQLQSFNASSYSMNLGLCGPPLTSSCPGDETPRDSQTSTPDDESFNEESETWFDKLWFHIGLGAGFTIGFCGVCGILLINTTSRNSYFRFMQSIGDWLYVTITVKGAALRRKLALH